VLLSTPAPTAFDEDLGKETASIALLSKLRSSIMVDKPLLKIVYKGRVV
jgi:hypothetical protein